MSHPGAFSWRARARSFVHAFAGLGALLREEHNARLHAAATVAVVALGAAVRLTYVEWALLVVAFAGVWSAEAMNAAVERLADAVTRERHPLIGAAKDLAAAAVLLWALGAAVVGALLLGPKLWAALVA